MGQKISLQGLERLLRNDGINDTTVIEAFFNMDFPTDSMKAVEEMAAEARTLLKRYRPRVLSQIEVLLADHQ